MATWKKLIYSGSRAELADVTASAVSPMRFPNITTNGSLRALVVDANGNVFKSAADIGTSTLTLTDSYIYVGNGSNIATGVPVSGDMTITNTGVMRLSGSAIGNQTLDTSLVGTEEMLMLDGTTLKKTTVSALQSFNSTGSFTGSFTGSIRQPLTSANILVGNASNIAAAVAMSGDITITNAGVTAIGANKVVASMLETAIISNLTDYAGGLPLHGTQTEFFISSGSTSLNRALSYNQLTGSISASFASAGFFGGDRVQGPASSLDNEIAIFNSTTGKIIKQSAAFVTPTGILSGSAVQTSGGATIGTSLQVNGNTTLGDASADTVTINGTTTFVGNSVTTTLQGSGSIAGDLTVGGSLFVNGTLTQVNTDNLQVEDRFILLASGSTSAGDSGIILQQAATTGVVFGYSSATDKFAVQKSFSTTANNFGGTPTIFVPTVESNTGAPASAPTFGSTSGLGTIYINTTTEDIWIYS